MSMYLVLMACRPGTLEGMMRRFVVLGLPTSAVGVLAGVVAALFGFTGSSYVLAEAVAVLVGGAAILLFVDRQVRLRDGS